MGFSLARAAFAGLGEAADSGSCGSCDRCGRAGFAGAGVRERLFCAWVCRSGGFAAASGGARRTAGRVAVAGWDLARSGRSGGSLHCPLNS
jgi:hypothetical protein